MGSIARRALLAFVARLSAVSLLRQHPAEAAPAAMIPISEFLALSTRLTGHTKLDPKAANLYWSALGNDVNNRRRLADLVRGRSSHPDLERAIILFWYTGIYETAGEKRLAMHRVALIWDAVGVAPPGTCGGPTGFWARPPAEPR